MRHIPKVVSSNKPTSLLPVCYPISLVMMLTLGNYVVCTMCMVRLMRSTGRNVQCSSTLWFTVSVSSICYGLGDVYADIIYYMAVYRTISLAIGRDAKGHHKVIVFMRFVVIRTNFNTNI